MRDDGLVPERVLCSPAVRTRQTWQLMMPILGERPVSYPDDLYSGGPAELLDRIRQAEAATGALMVIGHNPTLEDLALDLTDPAAPVELRSRLAAKFPTAALAVIEFDGGWNALEAGAGRLAIFLRPKDLPRAEERGL
jgi:phosphohistidine phosphatase